MEFFFRELLINIRKNIFLNVVSVSTIMLLVLMLGSFLLMMYNVNFIMDKTSDKARIVAEIGPSVPYKDVQKLQRKIAQMLYVEKYQYVSGETGLKRLQQRLKHRVTLNNLPANPIPATFEIKVTDPEKIAMVAKQIEKLSGIVRVRFFEDITRNIVKLQRALYKGGIVLIVILFIFSILIINNTIRLTVYARRKEIRIMQLVGAHNWFIRWPFILEGILHGLIGSAIALIILNAGYVQFTEALAASLKFVPFIPADQILAPVSFALLGLGTLIGAEGSLLSVNKFLKV